MTKIILIELSLVLCTIGVNAWGIRERPRCKEQAHLDTFRFVDTEGRKRRMSFTVLSRYD